MTHLQERPENGIVSNDDVKINYYKTSELCEADNADSNLGRKVLSLS